MTTKDPETGRIWYSNAKEIGRAIGRSSKEIPRLVDQDGLPAFYYRRRWTATPEDLKKWARGISLRYKARQHRKS